MSHRLQRPHRRRHLARLLSRAAHRLLPTRQAGQARGRPTPPASQPRPAQVEGERAGRGVAPHRNDDQLRRAETRASSESVTDESEAGLPTFSTAGGSAVLLYKEHLLAEVRRVAAVLRLLGPGSSRAGRLSWVEHDERSADRGAATVWVVGGIAACMVVMTAVYWLCGAVVARHEAEGAADLGALAAAVTAVDGEETACAEARWVVERMGAVLRSCRLSGWDALVEADVAYPPFGSAAARARAGPVEPNR
jgi:secretion/DNA translocation related TadE-like protein